MDQFVRSYPNGPLGSHVIGFVDAEHKGVQGIEASMDDYLQGQAGYEVIERDRKGREIRALRTEDLGPQDGLNVVLTVDQVVQHIAEQELDKAMEEFKPQSAVIIVSRPKTGEILAMSSRPTFDPTEMDATDADARRNRCISDVAEPGSTFKIVVCSGALNRAHCDTRGPVRLRERGVHVRGTRVARCASIWRVERRGDSVSFQQHRGGEGGPAATGPARLYEYIRRYGFGHKTDIDLPGEVSGIAHPLARWNSLSITRIPMGHEVAVTPLQMLMAMNTIANRGVRMRPMIVKSVVSEDGTTVLQYQPKAVGPVIAPHTCDLMTTALRKVVGPDGTAPKAGVDGFDVAGKTGTAQKVENGQYVRKYYSSFIGYFAGVEPGDFDFGFAGRSHRGRVLRRIGRWPRVTGRGGEYRPVSGHGASDSANRGNESIMKLAEIVKMVKPLAVVGPMDQEITGIAYDSRRVLPGLRCCSWQCVANGRTDIASSRRPSNGARQQSYWSATPASIRAPHASKSATPGLSMAQASAQFYNHPSQQLKVVGITGTNGKTTTAFMVQAIMEAAGISCGLLGTVQYQIGQRVIPASRTTPGKSVDIQDMMSARCCGPVAAACRWRSVPTRSTNCAWKERWISTIAVFTKPVPGPFGLPRDDGRIFRSESEAVQRVGHCPKGRPCGGECG